MFDFGARKENLHILISFDESNGDNTVTVTTKTSEGVVETLTGTIVFD